MPGRLEGKVAVITGSTSGIGAGTARRLHEEGAKVVVSGRNREKGEALAKELGPRAAYCRADVVKEDDVAGLIAFALDRFGRIDVLFNNAGDVTSVGSIETIDTAAFRYDLDLLVGGVFYGMKHAVPHMRRQKSGSIINTASVAAHRTFTNKIYGAAKAAVVHLTKGVAMEVAEHGIRVNSVSPGAIMTPIFLEVEDRARPDAAERVERLRQPFTEFQPLPIAGAPLDIANAVLFLASDESRFITGHDLVVDGGKIMGLTPADSRAMWDKLNAAMGA